MPKKNSKLKSSTSPDEKMRRISKESQDSLKRVFEASFSDSIKTIHDLSEKLPSELRKELERSVRRVSSEETLNDLKGKLNDVDKKLEQNIQDKDTAEEQVQRVEEKIMSCTKQLNKSIAELEEMSRMINSTILESSSKDIMQQASSDLISLKESLENQNALLKNVILDKETAERLAQRIESHLSDLEEKYLKLVEMQSKIKGSIDSKAGSEAEFQRENMTFQQGTASSLKRLEDFTAEVKEISIEQKADINVFKDEVRRLRFFSMVGLSMQIVLILLLIGAYLLDKI